MGGAGLTNPAAIRYFCDYAVIGRCEDYIANVVDIILRGKEPIHESIMHLPDIHNVIVGQAARLYHREIGKWRESFIGCRTLCKFCQYSWMHRFIGEANTYVNTGLCNGNSPELMWKDLPNLQQKHGRIRCAIDGYSERLRYLYGKPISKDMIISGIEAVGAFQGITVLLVYNIAGLPTESEDDRQELTETLRQANPANRVIFILHSTPFRPSNLTPLQWAPVDTTSLKPLRAKMIVDKPNFMAKHSFSLEGPFSQMMCLLVERYKPQYRDALDWTVTHRKHNQEQMAGLFADRWSDVYHGITREYIPHANNHPANMIESFTPSLKLKNIADKLAGRSV